MLLYNFFFFILKLKYFFFYIFFFDAGILKVPALNPLLLKQCLNTPVEIKKETSLIDLFHDFLGSEEFHLFLLVLLYFLICCIARDLLYLELKRVYRAMDAPRTDEWFQFLVQFMDEDPVASRHFYHSLLEVSEKVDIHELLLEPPRNKITILKLIHLLGGDAGCIGYKIIPILTRTGLKAFITYQTRNGDIAFDSVHHLVSVLIEVISRSTGF